MSDSKFLEFLKVIKGKLRRDLRDFIFVTSNQLSKREKEIFLNILNEKNQRNLASELSIVESYLKDSEKANWNRIKSRLTRVIKRYLLLTLIEDKEPMSTILLLEYFISNKMKKNFSSSLKKEYKYVTKKKLSINKAHYIAIGYMKLK